METKFNRPPINDDRSGYREDNLSIFKGNGLPRGASTRLHLSTEEFKEVWLYILHNCDEVSPFVEQHKDKVAGEGAVNVHDCHRAQFPTWFYTQVWRLKNVGGMGENLCNFAMGPHQLVHRYDTFIVNGFKFHTSTRDQNRKSQNSGVVVRGDESFPVKEYYGVLTDIYRISFLGNNEVFVFKCRWWDTIRQGVGFKTDKWGVTWVNTGRTLDTVENYVLAGQCSQVYYIADIRNDKWMAVAKNFPRHVYAIPVAVEVGDEVEGAAGGSEAYQEGANGGDGSILAGVDAGSNYEYLRRNDFEIGRVNGRLVDLIRDAEDRVCQQSVTGASNSEEENSTAKGSLDDEQ